MFKYFGKLPHMHSYKGMGFIIYLCVHLAIFWKKLKRWQISNSQMVVLAVRPNLYLFCLWAEKTTAFLALSSQILLLVVLQPIQTSWWEYPLCIHLISKGTKVCTNIIAQLSVHFDLVVSFWSNNLSLLYEEAILLHIC